MLSKLDKKIVVNPYPVCSINFEINSTKCNILENKKEGEHCWLFPLESCDFTCDHPFCAYTMHVAYRNGEYIGHLNTVVHLFQGETDRRYWQPSTKDIGHNVFWAYKYFNAQQTMGLCSILSTINFQSIKK